MGLELLGQQRKEFAGGEGPLREHSLLLDRGLEVMGAAPKGIRHRRRLVAPSEWARASHWAG